MKNVQYYLSKGLPFLSDFLIGPYFFSEPESTRGSYKDHLGSTTVLGESLHAGKIIPELIADHNLTVVSPEIDGAVYTFTAALGLTLTLFRNNMVVDKKAMAHGTSQLFFLYKIPANLVTKALNQHNSETHFAEETSKSLQVIKSRSLTSLEVAIPYGLKVLGGYFLGSTLDNHLILAVPAEHLFSCSASNLNEVFQTGWHEVLGELDNTRVPANSGKAVKAVCSGYSHLLTAGTDVLVGAPMIYLDHKLGLSLYKVPVMMVYGKHLIKGSAYALVDGTDKYLIANGYDDLPRFTAMTTGSLALSYLNYHIYKPFMVGFSNRYAKYAFLWLTLLFATAVEAAFYIVP
jgi:hypothetical protein